MREVTSREFRDKQATCLSLADTGEQVDGFAVTPELEQKLEAVRQEYARGESVSCETQEELHRFLESL